MFGLLLLWVSLLVACVFFVGVTVRVLFKYLFLIKIPAYISHPKKLLLYYFFFELLVTWVSPTFCLIPLSWDYRGTWMRKTQAQCFFCQLTNPSDLWYLLKSVSLLLGNPIRLHLFLGCCKGVINFQNAKPSPGYPNGLSAFENRGENGPVGISDLIAIPAQQHPKIY